MLSFPKMKNSIGSVFSEILTDKFVFETFESDFNEKVKRHRFKLKNSIIILRTILQH